MSTELKNYLVLDNHNRYFIESSAYLEQSKGPILIGAGTRICHGAYIEGPAVIGSDCMIGNYAFIRSNTIIGNNVRIGFSTEVKSSLIESDVTIGPQCFVGDSVIGQSVYLGAQVRTSNHRLDGKKIDVYINDDVIDTGCEKLGCYIGPHSRLGIQVIILPGRYISHETLVGPGIIIDKNLPTGKYILKQVVKNY